MNLPDILDKIATGRYYSESALMDAKRHVVTSGNDMDMLNRYLYGTETSTDHIRLQELANYIREYENDTARND